MKLKDFDYNLPNELIAQKPTRPRDHSRLLVLDKKTGRIEHKYFFNIPDYLKPGDVLVLNNSKVFPARLFGKKSLTGGRVEIFLLKKKGLSAPIVSSIPPARLESESVAGRQPLPPSQEEGAYGGGEVWQCLVRNGKVGAEIVFEKGLRAEIIKKNEDETYDVKFNKSGDRFMHLVKKIGQMPLPPYIASTAFSTSGSSYQTVYADDKKTGSVAAPTAGLHFTPRLIKQLKKKGVQIEYITLHVGLGTFAPVKTDDIAKHKMHAEWVEIDSRTVDRIKKAKKEKRRIIAVGTTSTRSLESALPGNKKSFAGWVDIFIYPPYKFKIVDAMITNFHLPKSTLLMLVSALAGKKNIDRAYKEAIKKKYRFFSFGDAMFIS